MYTVQSKHGAPDAPFPDQNGFTMLAVLAAVLLAAAADGIELRPGSHGPGPAWPANAIGCDDGTDRGTLVQREDLYYGNRLQSPCVGSRLTRIDFVHAGAPQSSAYRLHVLDANCGEIGVTPVLFTTWTSAAPQLEAVDVAAYGWCVEGDFRVLLEPLGCEQPSDCFPAVVVDGGTSADCAEVAVPAAGARSCLRARTSDGRGFAFRMRATFACEVPACTSAVVSHTWTATKQLYRLEAAPSGGQN